MPCKKYREDFSMSKKTAKRIFAALLAVTVMTGAGAVVPLTGLSDLSITAGAVSETIAVGDVYQKGDTINFGEGVYIKNVSKQVSGEYTLSDMSYKSTLISTGNLEEYELPVIGYAYVGTFTSDNGSFSINLDRSSHASTAKVWVADGDGTKNNPLVFRVLDSYFNNNSTLASDTVSLGESVIVTASANGGDGVYQYAVSYKKATDTKWTTVQNYSSNKKVQITPMKAVSYDIRVSAKDGFGNEKEKTFSVTVNPAALVNESTVSADSVALGNSVTVNAAAQGGVGSCQYAVFYRKVGTDKWTSVQAYDTNSTVTVTPQKKAAYEILVKAKDKKANVAEKTLTVNVTNPLPENTSTLSADTITLGESVTVNASATGGAGSFQYAVFYKKATDTKWTTAQAYSTNPSVAVTPKKKTSYEIFVKAKDKNSTVIEKTFSVTVK